jgi:hypothetical protein
MINKMKDEKVEENVNSLQELLIPKEKIIDIFNRLGENFKFESGAMALSRDLSYLENLAVKADSRLNVEERAVIAEYLDSIKNKMIELETSLDKIMEYFAKLDNSTHIENHEILKSRLADIKKIVVSNDTKGLMVSRMTKDLNLIIENMRQCLGCRRKEYNNDTNLAFGDYNKFYLMNQTEKEKGSDADEIVFFVPVTRKNGQKEMSFVMDNVYGKQTVEILINNTIATFKKYRAIKNEIPEAKISVSISGAAMFSVGVNASILSKRLAEAIPDLSFNQEETGMTAFIPTSSFSDNYIEFCNGDARETGDRAFSGLVLK